MLSVLTEQQDIAVTNACFEHSAGRQFSPDAAELVSEAGESAAIAGENIEAAVKAACIRYDRRDYDAERHDAECCHAAAARITNNELERY